MKDKIIAFFKDKFNIALITLQVVAIISYFLSFLVGFISYIFFVLESAFFIVWGIKSLISCRKNKYSMEIYEQLPYTTEDRISLKKQNEKNNKNNKFIGIVFILLGIIILITLLSSVI